MLCESHSNNGLLVDLKVNMQRICVDESLRPTLIMFGPPGHQTLAEPLFTGLRKKLESRSPMECQEILYAGRVVLQQD